MAKSINLYNKKNAETSKGNTCVYLFSMTWKTDIKLNFLLLLQLISGVHHFGQDFLHRWPFYNTTIEVVTFPLRGLELTLKQKGQYSPLFIIHAGKVAMDNSMVGTEIQCSQVCCNRPATQTLTLVQLWSKNTLAMHTVHHIFPYLKGRDAKVAVVAYSLPYTQQSIMCVLRTAWKHNLNKTSKCSGISIHHTYNTSLQSSPSHNQRSTMFETLHAIVTLNKHQGHWTKYQTTKSKVNNIHTKFKKKRG